MNDEWPEAITTTSDVWAALDHTRAVLGRLEVRHAEVCRELAQRNLGDIMEDQMRDKDTDDRVTVEIMLERERHRRIVAEQALVLAEARIAAAASYLESLTDTPLKEAVLRNLGRRR